MACSISAADNNVWDDGSAFLATRCLQQLGEDGKEHFPLGSKKILSDFYMDDFISGADTEEELMQVYREVSALTDSAHFTLRKWHSNNACFMLKLDESEKEKLIRVNDVEIIKTLGIVWEPGADHFRYVWQELPSTKT